MGLPKILIEFKTLAETIIARSERGIVAVILKDNSNTTESHTYTKESEIVKSHFTASNLAYLSLIFMGNPSKVIVERMQTDSDISVALERLKNKHWYYLTVPSVTDDEKDTVVEFIKNMRNTFHKTFKAVLPSCDANFEGIINFCTDNIKVGSKTYTTSEFCARIAGILAGLPLNRSATYFALNEVTSITESETPDEDVDNGKLILINDGIKIKIARGVNSFTDFNDEKGEDFSKIKIIEAIDMMRDDVRTTFEDEFVGKVENSYDNKIVFVAAVNKYFKDLANRGVLYDEFDNKAEIDIESTRQWLSLTKDVSSWEDEKIKTANTGTYVFLKANVQVQDAIEDMNFGIYIE